MKKRYIFSLAAMALLTAACSSDEMALNPADQPAPVEQKIPFTAVISADAAGTRALTEASDGKTITAKWEKEEKVALIHGEIIDVLEVSNVDATSGAATISGTITSPANDESVFVVYVGHQHVNMSQLQGNLTGVTGDIAEADISEAMNPMLMTQDGTLKGISDNFDFRLATAKFAVKDSKATFASEVKMPAKYAIWKLNLTTDGTTALKANKLVMKKNGEADVTIDLGTETSSEFYVAFIASPSTYSFEATDSDDKTYSCTPTVSALDRGKYYRSTLTMAAAATGNTYRVYTAKDTYTDETIPSTATTLTGTVNPGDLAAGTYVVSGTATCAGDLTLTGDVNLILKDGASLTVNGCIKCGVDGEGNPNYAYSLNIYGQELNTGKLTIDSNRDDFDIIGKDLTIHGGIISATNAQQPIETDGVLAIYNGKVTAEGIHNGFEALNDCHIYGGTIVATATHPTGIGFDCGGNLVIDGGSITATGGNGIEGNKNGGAGISCKNITITDGNIIATGGNAYSAETDAVPSVGIDTLDGGTLTVKGGNVTAIGGEPAEGGENAIGIRGVITLTVVTMYEGDSANPTVEAESQTECTCRYVIIKPAE